MEALTISERAYLSGLFDGEGTVAIYESSAPTKDGNLRPIWIYQVQIANTSFKVLEFVKQKCGGNIAQKSRGPEHWRQGFVWRTCGNSAVDFMNSIREFSIIKASEIDEAIAFRRLCLPRGHRQTEDEINEKRAVVLRLKGLKRAV